MLHLDDVPEEYDGVLDCASLAICCSFNRRGSLLAVGCNDGRIVIWDFLTRGIASHIIAHVNHPICSIGWSRDGHKIISASLDNTVAVWHVLKGDCIMRWKFPSPILKAQFNPRNDKFALVCLVKHPPLLIEIDYKQNSVRHKVLPVEREENDLNIVASFDRRGQYIYTGNAKGRIAILQSPKSFSISSTTAPTTNSQPPLPDQLEHPQAQPQQQLQQPHQPPLQPQQQPQPQPQQQQQPQQLQQQQPQQNQHETCQQNELRVISSFRLQTTGSTLAAIKEIEFSARDKKYFLINSTDKIIRLFECQSALKAGVNGNCLEVRKLQDLVNKTMWRRCCFSGNASHVCGGSTRQHALHIWETETGVIKKVLIGTKGELLLDIQWHPMRPVLASISSGLISLWTRPQIENWSAFAPDFRELEENEEYDERESEFDDEDEDNQPKKTQETDMDVIDDVDVIQVEPDISLLSSDEEDFDTNALQVLPITIEDLTEHNDIDSTTLKAPTPADVEQLESKAEIDITLDNPPIDEPHPLVLASTKRMRVSDKMGIARKVPRL